MGVFLLSFTWTLLFSAAAVAAIRMAFPLPTATEMRASQKGRSRMLYTKKNRRQQSQPKQKAACAEKKNTSKPQK